jgi:tRNA G18 (ribose-2'-O)-methylase SpoU
LKKNFRKRSTSELERKNIHEYKNAVKTPIVLVLDNIRSANNVGSIFRTADAFLIEHIYLCGITACPPHKDIHKTALGAELSVPHTYYNSTTEAINFLQSHNYTIISIEQAEGSTALHNFEQTTGEKYALIFGNEVFGVSDDVIQNSDICIEIPQLGTKHSFNVSVTCGIVLWELSKKYI